MLWRPSKIYGGGCEGECQGVGDRKSMARCEVIVPNDAVAAAWLTTTRTTQQELPKIEIRRCLLEREEVSGERRRRKNTAKRISRYGGVYIKCFPNTVARCQVISIF